MKKVVLTLVFLFLTTAAMAQVANPTDAIFNSADHNSIIPAGSIGAGQPTITSYQGLVFPVAADPVTAQALLTGTVVLKGVAVAIPGTTPQDYRLSLAQMGLTLPLCTVAGGPCPQYRLLIRATGPGGISIKTAANASGPFSAAVPPLAPAPVPVEPGNIRLQ